MRDFPLVKEKVAVHDALKKVSSSSGMNYTLVCTGPFLDWGIAAGLIMNLKEKIIHLYDGGDRVFSATTLLSVGKAVVGVLRHPQQTKNRAVYVRDTATTLKKLAAMAKEATGAEGWKEIVVSIDELLEQAWAELKKDKPNPSIFLLNFIKAAIFGEGYGGHFETTDNELLGIKEMSDAEVQAVVHSLAK